MIAIKNFSEKIGTSYKHHSLQATIEDFIDEKDFFFEELLSLIDDSIIYDNEKEEFGKENEAHITILYGLLYDKDYISIRNKYNTWKPFEIELGDISIFESNIYDVVKIDIKSKHLHIMHSYLKNKYKNVFSYPEYIPHMTLAYVKKGMYDNRIINPYLGKKILVDSITWKHKNGYGWSFNLEGR